MKFSNKITTLFLFLSIVQCKKASNRLNVALYNKSIPIIKSYIGGKWNLDFATGGIANQGQNFNNVQFFFDFKTIDSFFYVENDSIRMNAHIIWSKVLFNHQDSSTIFSFTYKGSFPYDYCIDRIQNDTLILCDIGVDGYTYWLTRR